MNVEAELVLKAIDKKLQMESVLDDIFEDLGADVVGTGDEAKVVPDAIFLKIGAQPTGTRQVTIPFLQALSGDPTIGPFTPVGREAKQNLKYATFKYQEYSFAVAHTAWGTTYNDMSVYGVFEKIQPQISQYMKEFHGQRIREALLLTHDSVLTTLNPTGGTPVEEASFNKNWFISNTEVHLQPQYDSVLQDFVNTIGSVMVAAASDHATNPEATEISLNYLLALEYYATNYLKIDPIIVSGKKTYVVLIPSTQVQKLKSNTSGQLGDIYTSMVRSSEDEMRYTGVLGRVGSLLLVEDQRYPTLVRTDDGTNHTLTPTFVKPGNVDGRAKTPSGDERWDVGFLLGKAAVAELEVQPLHFETEEQNYGRDRGTGAFGESGISLVEYDVDEGSVSDTSKENKGSIVLAWTIPSIIVS
jgi:hypothetical protein